MTIDEICAACINALRSEHYNESTIFNYEGVIRRFKQFCKEQDVTIYSSEIGKAYADDVISTKTGKFSKNRYHTQGRFYRLIDSYFSTGIFDFSLKKKEKLFQTMKFIKRFTHNTMIIFWGSMIMIIPDIFMSMECIAFCNF